MPAKRSSDRTPKIISLLKKMEKRYDIIAESLEKIEKRLEKINENG
tara:strand:- start:294 stop:431 length:138 start_codon:yes stop_codon:yes gene_type:complete